MSVDLSSVAITRRRIACGVFECYARDLTDLADGIERSKGSATGWTIGGVLKQ